MLYKDFQETLLHIDRDIQLKFSDGNKIYYLGCEPFEYSNKQVLEIDFLVNGDQVCYEVDEEAEYVMNGYFKSESVLILIKIKED